MNRKDRRRQERAEAHQKEKDMKQAALMLQNDMKRNGDYDVRAALTNKYYMANVIEQRTKVREKWSVNGITEQDLNSEWDKGYKAGYDDGFKRAGENVARLCYAGIMLALHEKYGFGKKRCAEALNAVDKCLNYSLTSADAVQEVWDKIGIEIDFQEAVDDRISVKECGAK